MIYGTFRYRTYAQTTILRHYEQSVPLRGSKLRGASRTEVIAKA